MVKKLFQKWSRPLKITIWIPSKGLKMPGNEWLLYFEILQIWVHASSHGLLQNKKVLVDTEKLLQIGWFVKCTAFLIIFFCQSSLHWSFSCFLCLIPLKCIPSIPPHYTYVSYSYFCYHRLTFRGGNDVNGDFSLKKSGSDFCLYLIKHCDINCWPS